MPRVKTKLPLQHKSKIHLKFKIGSTLFLHQFSTQFTSKQRAKCLYQSII